MAGFIIGVLGGGKPADFNGFIQTAHLPKVRGRVVTHPEVLAPVIRPGRQQPGASGSVGQEIPLVELDGLPRRVQTCRAVPFCVKVPAELFKYRGIHPYGQFRVEKIEPPAVPEHLFSVRKAEVLQKKAASMQQGLCGICRICAVNVAPEQIKYFVLCHRPVVKKAQILQKAHQPPRRPILV